MYVCSLEVTDKHPRGGDVQYFFNFPVQFLTQLWDTICVN